MKIPPLPPTDLANIASLPHHLRRDRLQRIKANSITWSYGPVKGSLGDIFNCKTELFGALHPVDWSKLSWSIASRCRSPEEVKYNIAVAKALYDYSVKNRIFSRARKFLPLQLGLGRKIEFWAPLIIVSDERPIIPFVDPRLNSGLTSLGRRFVFSVMHERIRVADPDLYTSRFCIMKFEKQTAEASSRLVIPLFDDGVELMTFNELDQAVSETYSIWEEIFIGRLMKKRASGGTGTLI